jgi:hypothetical protein
MRFYNVLVPVVELIEADDAETAIAHLKSRLEAAGFDTSYYGNEGAGPMPNAFESEAQPT